MLLLLNTAHVTLIIIVMSLVSLGKTVGEKQEENRKLSPEFLAGSAFSREGRVAEVGGGLEPGAELKPTTPVSPLPLPACWTMATPVTTSTPPAPASASQTKL